MKGMFHRELPPTSCKYLASMLCQKIRFEMKANPNHVKDKKDGKFAVRFVRASKRIACGISHKTLAKVEVTKLMIIEFHHKEPETFCCGTSKKFKQLWENKLAM